MPNNLVIDISHHNGGPLDFVAAKNAGVVGVMPGDARFRLGDPPTAQDRGVSAGCQGRISFRRRQCRFAIEQFLGTTGIDNAMLYALTSRPTPATSMSLAQAGPFRNSTPGSGARLSSMAEIF